MHAAPLQKMFSWLESRESHVAVSSGDTEQETLNDRQTLDTKGQ